MNYLAHIFLSGTSGATQVGNFIGDFVKGNSYASYPKGIRKGILLHRMIDDFTDQHHEVKSVITGLRPHFGRYSAIIADMYFDYFLALNFSYISDGKSLRKFSNCFYMSVLLRYFYLPAKVRFFIFHFITTNRLVRYSTKEGLCESLEIMSKYKVPALDPPRILEFLSENEQELERSFLRFIPDLIGFVQQKSPV